MTRWSEALARFYRDRRVLVTGNTGFKGSWLTLWLRSMGATTIGVALPPVSPLSMYTSSKLEVTKGRYRDRFCDLRQLAEIRAVFDETKPEIVFHLAAQAIVGNAYTDPITTFETNVLGSANILECVRSSKSVAAAVMITSDKCYENVEQIWGYREHDLLGGADPYSASKAAAENVISSYSRSYFNTPDSANVASARAGNVVGGGDWSPFRLVPDCIRSLRHEKPIKLRNPNATRPWQFVLEPLAGYLMLGQRLSEIGKKYQCAWNFGPPVDNNNTVKKGAQAIVKAWGSGSIQVQPGGQFHESQLLALDCTKANRYLGWRAAYDFLETMRVTTSWFKHQQTIQDGDMRDYSIGQVEAYTKSLDRRSDV